MGRVEAIQPETRELLRRSAEWRLYALLFEYPDAAWRRNLARLLPSLDCEELRAMGEAALEGLTEGLHLALFGPSGSVPVREASYQGGVQLGYLMSELEAYYQAFAFTPGGKEAADHLSVELGFLAYLYLKRAYALMQGNLPHAEVAAQAAVSFLREHVAALAAPVAGRLAEYAPDYLATAGRRILAIAGPAPTSAYLFSGTVIEEHEEDFSCRAEPAEGLIRLAP